MMFSYVSPYKSFATCFLGLKYCPREGPSGTKENVK